MASYEAGSSMQCAGTHYGGPDPATQLRMTPATGLAEAVAAQVGGLNADEHARLFGAAQAIASGDPDSPVLLPQARVDELAAAIVSGRIGPCPFCQMPFSEHTLTVNPDETDIWCTESISGRPVAEWLQGPFRPSPLQAVAAVVMWVGIPAVSLGLLSWLPALIAGARRRRRAWLVAAGVWAALTVAVAVALPAGDTAAAAEADGSAFAAFGLWVGSMGYGAGQVKPWLGTLRARRSANRRTGNRTTGNGSGLGARAASTTTRAASVNSWLDELRARLAAMKADLRAEMDRRQARTEANRARREADRRRRTDSRALAAWESEDALRRYALWCADTLLGGGGGAFGGSPIILRRGESLLWSGAGQLIEPRRAPGHYSGGSAGVSVPIGLGMRANVGSHRGTYHPGPELQTPVDSGAVAVTSQRVVFTGGKKTREWAFAKLLTVQQSRNGQVILLPVSNRQAVSGVNVRTDSVRFGAALEVAAAAQAGDLRGLREELAAHLAQHEIARPVAPAA